MLKQKEYESLMNIHRTKEQFFNFTKEMKDRRVLIVSDVNTAIFAKKITDAFSKFGICFKEYQFKDEHLIPEIENLSEVLSLAVSFDYILAVGSGTINDICKYVSHKASVPYGIFATAPSMDGYASSISALYESDKKITVPTTTPLDIFIDIEVLKNAPIEMITAGVGDMVGKYTSLLDWKLSAVLNGENYNQGIAERMATATKLCLKRTTQLKARTEESVSALIEGLILSGIEMKNAGCSRPASGSEHHISHYLEMAGEKRKVQFASHGIQVALGSLVSNFLYRYALNVGAFEFEEIKKEALSLPELEYLISLYKRIGLPMRFSDIGVDNTLLFEAITNAHKVRDRFTIISYLRDRDLLTLAAEQFIQKYGEK